MKADSSLTVSALITSFNSASTIEEAIKSVLDQSRAVDKVIVVDDGSTDNSVELIKAFEPMVHLVLSKSQSPSGARNAGLEYCNTDFIALLDGDDTWHHDKIATQLGLALLNLDCNVIASNWSRDQAALNCVVTETTRLYCSDILILNRFQTSTALVSREGFRQAGNFDPEMDTAEDWDMWIRLSKFGNALLANAPMVFYRDNPSGVSKKILVLQAKVSEIIDREYQDNYLDRRYISNLRAWHHQRFIFAALLSKDASQALRLIKELPHRGTFQDHMLALKEYTLPFVFRRFTLRFQRAVKSRSAQISKNNAQRP